MKLLLLLAHSIAEYDDVRMFTDLGHDVFSIGAYTDPRNPGDDKRPPLPATPYHPELAALVPDQMRAKAHLPAELIEWADAIIVHHFPEDWIIGQWQRIRHKRVIWRTCGQSHNQLERVMTRLRSEGLQIVRYSPSERRYFEPAGAWAGQDALIRFGKYPADYPEWQGGSYVANVTQDMVGRAEACGLAFYLEATQGLDARPAGPKSEQLPGGIGALDYPAMLDYLAHAGAYLYTGTTPASYTLGLIEAMLVGVPIVSIGARAWQAPAALFEGDDLIELHGNHPAVARELLKQVLTKPAVARYYSRAQVPYAHALFDVALVGEQWQQFLDPVFARGKVLEAVA